jgi:hypothetical protein
MNKISFYGIVTTIVLSALVLTSCDQEFDEVGSGIVNDDHFAFLPDDASTVRAYSQEIGIVQSNNLPLNLLGYYDNPIFGKVTANFVTQLELGTLNPVFALEKKPVLDSVVMTIPYFSTKTSAAGKDAVYRLDSIKGTGEIDLKIFESGYVLNDLNPSDNFQSQQSYFTNQDDIIQANKKGTVLNNASDVRQNTQFQPKSSQYITYKLDRGLELITPKEVDVRSTPRLRLKMDMAFFKDKIMNAPEGKLANNSVFKEYFRGIYFQADNATSNVLMQLDFSKGDITLHYHEYSRVVDGVPEKYETSTKDSYGGMPKVIAKTVVLNFKGNSVSLLKTENSSLYNNGIANPNRANGDSNLYIKGGVGSFAVIDLFGGDNFGKDGLTGSPDGIADELNIIRSKGWLINEANLTFFIDRDKMGNAPNPQRVYLFDLTNNRPLLDWRTDNSGLAANPKQTKLIHDGLLQKEEKLGTKYRIRITDHIRNLIRKDSTNVRLGLSVTEGIALVNNVKLKTPLLIEQALTPSTTFKIDRLPVGSLLSPLGTILYGNNIAPNNPNYKKRLKLEIYYTKPN